MTQHISFFSLYAHPLYIAGLILSFTVTIQESLQLEYLPSASFDGGGRSQETAALASLGQSLRRTIAGTLLVKADAYVHGDRKATKLMENAAEYVRISSFVMSDEVVPALQLAIKLDPNCSEAYVLLARRLANDMNRGDEVIRILQKAILARPDHPRVYQFLAEIGRIHFKRKNWLQSRNYYRRASQAFVLIFDKKLCEAYGVEPDERDQVDGSGILSHLAGAAYRARDYQTAWDVLQMMKDQVEIDQIPMIDFLRNWIRDPSIAEGFDPVQDIRDRNNNQQAGGPSDLDDETRESMEGKDLHEHEGHEALELSATTIFQLKLLGLCLLPTFFILRGWRTRRQDSRT